MEIEGNEGNPFDARLNPDYAELHDEACGGSMQVEAISGGAALSCGWGC